MDVGVQLLPTPNAAPPDRGPAPSLDNAQHTSAGNSFAAALRDAQENTSGKADNGAKDTRTPRHARGAGPESGKDEVKGGQEAAPPGDKPQTNDLLASLVAQTVAPAQPEAQAASTPSTDGDASSSPQAVEGVEGVGDSKKTGWSPQTNRVETDAATSAAGNKHDVEVANTETGKSNKPQPAVGSAELATNAIPKAKERIAEGAADNATAAAGAAEEPSIPLTSGVDARGSQAHEGDQGHSKGASVSGKAEVKNHGDAPAASGVSSSQKTDSSVSVDATGKAEIEPPPTEALDSSAAPNTEMPAASSTQAAGPAQGVTRAESPAPADAGEAETGSGVADQIADQVRRLEYPRNSHVRLHLQPESLGAVDLHLRMRDGVLTLDIHAYTDHGRSQLESALPQLRSALGERGIDVGRVALSQGNPQMGGGLSADDSQRKGWEMAGWASRGQEHSRHEQDRGRSDIGRPYGEREAAKIRGAQASSQLVDLWV